MHTQFSLLELSERQLLQAPNADVIVLDGAAVAHMLRPGMTITFQDYVVIPLAIATRNLFHNFLSLN